MIEGLLPTGLTIHDVVFWIDGLDGSLIDRKTGTVYTGTDTTFLRNDNSGGRFSFNGTSTKITVGDVGNIKSFSMWCNAVTNDEPIVDFNGTANFDIITGTLTGVNVTSPTLFHNGTDTATGFVGSGEHLVGISTATAVDGNAVVIGNIGAEFFGGNLGMAIAFSKEMTLSQHQQLYNKFQ